MARKRGFGPFGAAVPERALREKQIAAMLRAAASRQRPRIGRCRSPEAAEQWAAQGGEDGECD